VGGEVEAFGASLYLAGAWPPVLWRESRVFRWATDIHSFMLRANRTHRAG
jgi:hypothetical protein